MTSPVAREDHFKEHLRAQMLAYRQDHLRPVRAIRSRMAVSLLMRLSVWSGARVVFAYFPVRGEADPRALVRLALREGRTVALPRVTGRRGMEFIAIRGLTGLRRGPFGIPEPGPGAVVPLSRAGIVVVPGLAFSADGHRLGYGGGYYDRFLRGRPCPAVGLAFESQVVSSLPRHRGDEALDAFVTERRVVIPPQVHISRSSSMVPPE